LRLPKWAGTVLVMDTTTIRTKVAAEVNAARELSGTSVAALAELAAISRTTLQRSLDGGRPFQIEELIRIGYALDTPFEQFLVIPDLKAG
jgi:lambda repressor-like predicted transcriptional regulator